MNTRSLLIPAVSTTRDLGTTMDFAPGGATGFKYLRLQVRRIAAGETFKGNSNSNERVIVGLGWNIRFEIYTRKLEQHWVSCKRIHGHAVGRLPAHPDPVCSYCRPRLRP